MGGSGLREKNTLNIFYNQNFISLRFLFKFIHLENMCTISTLVMAVTAPSCLPSIPAQSPLPVQQIPRATSAKIEDKQGRLAAVGALVRYSTNQGYFILQHLDNALSKKAVRVHIPDENAPLNLRIDTIQDNLPDRTFMPMYIQVHHNADHRLVVEHLIDNLSENTLGRHNLELKKNITIDVFDSDGDEFLRDNAGFIVTDRLQFHQITVDARQTLRVLRPNTNLKVEEVTSKKGYDDLLEYDGNLSSHNRAEFLEFLYTKSRVYVARGKKATETGEEVGVLGYAAIAHQGDRILCLYAESQSVAEALVAHHLKQSGAEKVIIILLIQMEKFQVIFCTTLQQWTQLHSLGSYKSRVIYRRHTRAVPANIKWENIFAINVGMNIF